MAYYGDDFGEGAIRRLNEDFSEASLNSNIGYCDRITKEIEKYRAACLARIMEIGKVEFRWHVELRKTKDYSTGKVEFDVTAMNIPQVPEGRKHAIVLPGDSKRFIGNEKRAEAVALAQSLAEKYKCKIQVIHLTLTRKEEVQLSHLLPETGVLQV